MILPAVMPMPILIPITIGGYSSDNPFLFLLFCIIICQYILVFTMLYVNQGEITKKQFLLSLIPFWFVVSSIQWFIRTFKEME